MTWTRLMWGAFFWVVISLLLGWLHSKKPKADVVSNDADAEAAIDTLVGLGFSFEEAENRVFIARLQSPDADFQTLVNLAVRDR